MWKVTDDKDEGYCRELLEEEMESPALRRESARMRGTFEGNCGALGGAP